MVADRASDLALIRYARASVGTGAVEEKAGAVHVDRRPTCQHCGRRVGEYFGRPWRVRCPECRRTASRD